MTRRFRIGLLAALAGAATLLPGTGQAHRWWGGYGAPRPYIVAPPVYARPYPPPVILAPPRAYYAPPVYVAPRRYFAPRPYAAPGIGLWVR